MLSAAPPGSSSSSDDVDDHRAISGADNILSWPPRRRLRLRLGKGGARRSPTKASSPRALPPILQLGIVLAFYWFHVGYLTTRSVAFPFQLLPNNKGHFCSITFDSLLGLVVLASYLIYIRPIRIRRELRSQMMTGAAATGDGSSAQDDVGDDRSNSVETTTSSWFNSYRYPWRLPTGSVRWRLSTLVAGASLVYAYFSTGRFSLFWEDLVLSMSGLGFGLTVPRSRSLQVLLGHLTWVAVGSGILRWIPRPPPFFASQRQPHERGSAAAEPNGEGGSTLSPISSAAAPSSSAYWWYRCKIGGANWFLWTIGGYCVSSFLFNMADGVNQYVIPASLLMDQQETSIVSQLVTPEHNDLMASFLAYLAPCVSAPWWEEILYRGYALPALAALLGYPGAAFVQAAVFSAHHMSIPALLPLFVLGYAWGVLYRECRNLWVTVLIHALWNSRVFFCSWLGL
jgi:membrane protease YdiL (CAAX protease family)